MPYSFSRDPSIQTTTVFLPGESHGLRSLVGYSLWSLKELYTTQ